MKRKEAPEETSGYSWMDTYGDMVTLMLCFFVLLYSFSSIDKIKQQQIVSALSGNYGLREVVVFDASDVQQEAIGPIDEMVDFSKRQETPYNAVREDIDNSFDQLYENIRAYIEENHMSGRLSVFRTDDAIYLRFHEMALFNSGKADILPASIPVLEHVMKIIQMNISSISAVRIEGHTDNVPMHNAEFADNWDLSVKRATNTLRLVLATGLFDEKMLSAVGYGEYHPIATNDTAEGRAQNRRVDFVLMKKKTD